MTEVRFDDIPGLRRLISEEFGEFGPPIGVTQQMIDQFADLTNDPQWIHVDVERARHESLYQETVAHGFLVLSLLSGMRDGSNLKITGMGMVINYGADKLRFISPVPAGSKIHMRRRIVDVTEKPKGTMLTQESEIRVVDAARPAVIYRYLALLVPAAG